MTARSRRVGAEPLVAQDSIQGGVRHGLLRLPNGRQRWPAVGSWCGAIEAHHGDVVGYPEIGVMERVQSAVGLQSPSWRTWR